MCIRAQAHTGRVQHEYVCTHGCRGVVCMYGRMGCVRVEGEVLCVKESRKMAVVVFMSGRKDGVVRTQERMGVVYM